MGLGGTRTFAGAKGGNLRILVMATHIERMLSAMVWADAQLLAAIRAHAGSQTEALPLFGHVLAAEALWLCRLEFREPGVAVWPTLSIEECEALAGENARGYQRFLETLGESGLASTVRYRNSKGEEYTNSVLDMLTHVVIHGAYHRGQVARVIGRAGGQTPNTDYIAYIRSLGPSGA
jgi:uncharacterized damage-inducible protein DinB